MANNLNTMANKITSEQYPYCKHFYPHLILAYFEKRSDVTGNCLKWQLGENKAI